MRRVPNLGGAALRAAFPLVPTVDAKGKQGSVSAGEGVSEARSRDDAKEGRAEGGLLPLNVEAVATSSVNELGRASAIRLDSVKFNGQVPWRDETCSSAMRIPVCMCVGGSVCVCVCACVFVCARACIMHVCTASRSFHRHLYNFVCARSHASDA